MLHLTLLVSLMEHVRLTSPKYKVTRKTFLLPLIGLAAFLIYIYIFKVDLQEIIAEAQSVDPYFYSLAALSTLLDTFFFALAWHSLLKFLSVKISRLKAIFFVWIGVFVDTVVPAESVSGEITKIYLVNKTQSGSTGKATASIVAQRLIVMSLNIITLLVGAALLFFESQQYLALLAPILALVALTFLLLVLILLLCFKENWSMRVLDGFIRFICWVSRGRWKLEKVREDALTAARAFHDAMRQYRHAPKTLFTATFLTTLSWVLTLAVFYFTFISLHYFQITWGAILIIASIFVAVKSIPIGIPFEVGLPEIALSSLFIVFGVPKEISFTATILMRLLTLWLKFFVGFAAQQWMGIKGLTSEKVENASEPTQN